MEFRWLGVAGIELQLDGQVLAIDPFFTRPPFRRLWLGRVQPDRSLIAEKIPRCQFILISHPHYDHLMDAPSVAAHTGALALGSENACELLALLGTPAEQIRPIRAGDRLALGPYRVEVLPAEHIPVPGFGPGRLKPDLQPPLRLREYRMDASFCFLLEAVLSGAEPGVRLLVWCSERTEPAAPAEVLFLGLTRKRAYLESLLNRVQPKVVIPIHWDDLFRPLSQPIRPYFEPPRLGFPPLRRMDLDEFRRDVAAIAPGVRVLVPAVFRSYDMNSLLH